MPKQTLIQQLIEQYPLPDILEMLARECGDIAAEARQFNERQTANHLNKTARQLQKLAIKIRTQN